MAVAYPGGDEIRLGRGEALFVPAGTGDYGIAGEGTIYRVCVPPSRGLRAGGAAV